MKLLTILFFLSASVVFANSVEDDRYGSFTPALITEDNWKAALGSGFIYSSDPSDRVLMRASILYQRLDPSERGSTKDDAAVALPPNYRHYVVEQTIRFDSDWENVRGGKVGFGLMGGTNTSGGSTDPAGWSARLMFRPGNIIGLYTYEVNREFTNGGTWGDDNPAYEFTPGQWFTIKIIVRLNSDPNLKDGSMIAMVNGKVVVYKTNVQWQAENQPGDKVRGQYQAFFGGNGPSWAPSEPQYYRIKHVEYRWW